MHTQTIYRKLSVELSKEELAKRAQELAAKELEKDRVEEQKKAVGAPLGGLKLDIRRLSKVVDTGIEEQEVACDEIFDDDRFEVRIIRKDTGEKIHDRPYSSLERAEATQETLPFEVETTNGKKGKGQRTIFDAGVKVGPKDATPAPDDVEHNGQHLTKVKRGGAKKGKSRGKAARS
jgi:hypothetical protein